MVMRTGEAYSVFLILCFPENACPTKAERALFLMPAVAAYAQTSRAASAASYIDRGNEWMKKGELDKAIADYELAIAFDSRSAGAYYNRGNVRNCKGDFEGALKDFNRAIELDPRYENAYLNRGVTLCRKSDFDAGRGDCNEVVEIKPRAAAAYRERAVAPQQL